MVVAGNGMDEIEVGFAKTRYSFLKVSVTIVNVDVVAV
jgi:hypothetical protein